MKGSDVLILALGWVLFIEGVAPLVMPELWLKSIRKISESDPRAVRTTAAVMIAVGLGVVWTLLEEG